MARINSRMGINNPSGKLNGETIFVDDFESRRQWSVAFLIARFFGFLATDRVAPESAVLASGICPAKPSGLVPKLRLGETYATASFISGSHISLQVVCWICYARH